MSTVRSIHDAGNPPSLDAAYHWLEAMGKRGVLSPSSARLMITAIRQLTSVLGEDEPATVPDIAARIGDLADRWARVHQAKPATAQSYRQRAEKGLSEYLAYLSDPVSYKPDVRAPRPPRAEGDESPKPRAKTSKASGSGGGVRPAAAAPSGVRLRDYPLPNGREFVYGLPEGGITMEECRRIALHLATMASDFDPAVATKQYAPARGSSIERDD